MTIEWICKHHEDLGKEQLYAILQLRTEVFVVEQTCVFLDLDGVDKRPDVQHLLGWQGNQPDQRVTQHCPGSQPHCAKARS